MYFYKHLSLASSLALSLSVHSVGFACWKWNLSLQSWHGISCRLFIHIQLDNWSDGGISFLYSSICFLILFIVSSLAPSTLISIPGSSIVLDPTFEAVEGFSRELIIALF